MCSAEQIAAAQRGEYNFGQYSAADFTTLLGSVAEYKLQWVDVLKIDIEGSEWPVFREMIAGNDTIPFTQVCTAILCDDVPVEDVN